MALDLHGFYPDNTPNQALYKIADTLTENKKYKEEKAYRQQKDKEANQYRNYNIISDNTDLSKSLTGIPAIDKVYTDKMKGVYNELVQAAEKLSPIELAGMVNEKTTPIFSALNAARSDYANGQKLITEMTAQNKEFDKAKLTNDLTNRAINNYIDPETGQPIHSDAAHSLDFSIYSDPEYLSDFVSDENIIKGIRKPEGAETTTVLAGKPHDYTEYQTKNTLWTEPAYDQSKFDNQGFYTGGDIPQRKIKSEQIQIGGKPMDIVTDDVYNAFIGDMATHAAIVARAKKEFGANEYRKFNVNEKAIAEKHALYKYIKENDDTQLHPVKTVAPPVYHNRTSINMPGNNNNSGGGGGKIQGNVLDGMQDRDWGNFKTEGGKFYNKDGTPKTGEVFITGEFLPTSVKSVLKAGGIDPNYLMEGVNARIENGVVKSISNGLMGSVSREDMEGIYQPKFDTERKGESLKFPNSNISTTPKPAGKTPKYKGLDKNGNPIFE